MKKISRASGFSLVELMIVVALLGGLSLVVVNITKQSNKSSAKLQFDTDVTLTTNEIIAILSDPVKCLATFGSTATPANIVGKYFISTVPPGDQGYGNSALKITSYTLTGSAPDGVLTILYQNKNILKGTSGASNISKKINLYIEGSPGAITKCRALSTSTTDIWTHGSLSDSNNIFYNGGVRAGDETQTLNCDSTIEGTQRYNKTIHSMQYCGYNVGPPVTYTWVSGSVKGLGYGGEKWHDLSSSRAFNQTYTNTYNYPIMISVWGNSASTASVIYIDGLQVSGVNVGGNVGISASSIGLIPPGSTYRVTGGTMNGWFELY